MSRQKPSKKTWLDHAAEDMNRQRRGARGMYRSRKVESPKPVKQKVASGFEDLAASSEMTWLDEVSAKNAAAMKLAKKLFAATKRQFTGLASRSIIITKQTKLIVLVSAVAVLLSIGLVVRNQFQDSGVKGTTIEQPPSFDVGVSKTTETDSVKFDPENEVASFTDTINSSEIYISQQPLTEEQNNQPATFLISVATNLGADNSIKTKFNSAYLTATDGPTVNGQSVVFIANGLLIILRTDDSTLADSDWQDYINTIQF